MHDPKLLFDPRGLADYVDPDAPHLPADPRPPADAPDKKRCRKRLEDELVPKLARQQRKLYAHDHFSVLLVFQAMDAAGKDSTIRAILSGVNPSGCQVASFRRPSSEELEHDFLWRCSKRLPERGRIGVFNRSHYEEVLVVKVHPEILLRQRLPQPVDLGAIWGQRYHSIREWERHLVLNGTMVLKFWLNVSYEEQRERFLSRLDTPEKHWKFEEGDLHERKRWDDYQAAYRDALLATSRPWAPWFAIPADRKPYMRMRVAELVTQAIDALPIDYPEVSEADRADYARFRQELFDD